MKAKDIALLPLGLVYVALVVMERDRRARVAAGALLLVGLFAAVAVIAW